MKIINLPCFPLRDYLVEQQATYPHSSHASSIRVKMLQDVIEVDNDNGDDGVVLLVAISKQIY